MNLLVTGAAGYLGSVLCPMLLQAGHEVVALDNFMYRQTSLAECCAESRFTLVRGDCRDSNVLERWMRYCDFIIPLAAIVGAPACEANPQDAAAVNFIQILHIMAIRSPNQAVLFPTTNSGYGIGGPSECTEDSPLNPVSLYGSLKKDAEAEVLEGENTLSFRLATLFGMSPRMRLDILVNDFVHRAMRDKYVVLYQAHFRRNYLHVRDAASVFLWAIDHFDGMKGKAYNVGLPDANLTKWELCERIKTHVPEFHFAEAKVGEDPDKRDYLIDNSRIMATGWEPRYSLDDGIRELIKGYEIFKSQKWTNA